VADKTFVENCDFSIFNDTIHELALAVLLSERDTECMLTQDKYTYRVKGGKDGYLFYKKRASDRWILIANWRFYGLYIVVRYRKPIWLRPMYRTLFAKMNYVSVTFFDHSIEAIDKDWEILRSRRFRLSPPFALAEVMTREFGYLQEEIEELEAKQGL